LSRWLIISDLQIPFEHIKALEFCLRTKKEFNISNDNIVCIGDELDQYFGSPYLKDPSIDFSAVHEINTSKKKLRAWYKAFPKMQLCTSNHGLRWLKKAVDAEIPSQLLRPYKEIIEAPDLWVWKDELRFKCKYPWRAIHGMGYSGANGARNAAIDAGMSTVIGHLHAFAGVQMINTQGGNAFWAMNSGCLIDNEAFAFSYGRYSRNKPTLGCGVVIDEGKTPIFVPLGSL
jgi:hypothetical protein